MMKRIALLAGLLVIALPAAASAADRTRTIDSTVKAAQIESANGFNHFAGRITGLPAGRGAVLLQGRAIEGGQVSFTAVAYYRGGTIRVSGTNTPTAQPDGSVTFSGSGTIEGGTRRFRGATGSFTLTGSQPSGGTVQTYELDGRIRY